MLRLVKNYETLMKLIILYYMGCGYLFDLLELSGYSIDLILLI